MEEEKGTTRHESKRPAQGSVSHSIEEILKHIDPAPDAETECLVAAIYADRRESVRRPPSE